MRGPDGLVHVVTVLETSTNYGFTACSDFFAEEPPRPLTTARYAFSSTPTTDAPTCLLCIAQPDETEPSL